MNQSVAAERPNVIEKLTALLADDFDAVNRLILQELQSDVQMVPELAGYLIASGGKRIRPLMTLATARLCGYDGLGHLGLAAAVEFIHTATLLHDDVVDESTMRRGKETANEVWSNQASVLVGDFLFSRAFQLMVAHGSLPILKALSDASAVIAEGEVHQLMVTADIETGRETYLRVIEAKTAALFAAACEVGGRVAQAKADQVKALRDYGAYVGVAFQLVDDLLDYSANQRLLGKRVGDDFRETKMTLPAITAIQAASRPEETAFWKRTMAEGQQTNGDFDQALIYIQKHEGLKKTADEALHYAAKAKACLEVFDDGLIKQYLIDLCDFVVERAF